MQTLALIPLEGRGKPDTWHVTPAWLAVTRKSMQPFDTPPAATRFAEALRRIDEANSRDPNLVVDGKSRRPRELMYSEWLSKWVTRFCPEASEALRLAARCQHLCRWEIPRDSYPMTRAGYLKWRADLKKFHAQKSGEILREAGYDDAMVCRVQELNLKANFPNDPEVRVLEDALCLVFLERQFAELAAKTDEEKMINALQKSWNKMSPLAQAEASRLNYGSRERALLDKALGTSQ